ncbi:uncharacterized protein P884DRAFT_99562 [Thermothelomyces heterothallicus CBS 202.75]|uniref:uncharacterized protein n=1 Tax=Thermothelomyces heterothallicus CBS 202.75 TaxID=1149848 RepID=UPI0037421844
MASIFFLVCPRFSPFLFYSLCLYLGVGGIIPSQCPDAYLWVRGVHGVLLCQKGDVSPCTRGNRIGVELLLLLNFGLPTMRGSVTPRRTWLRLIRMCPQEFVEGGLW